MAEAAAIFHTSRQEVQVANKHAIDVKEFKTMPD
jgi:hypothetical protein